MGGEVDMTEDMLAVLICEKMHYTFQEYDAQPTWFIRSLIAKMQAEAKEARKEVMRAKTKSRA